MEPIQKMKKETNDLLKLDKTLILERIKSNKKYEEEGIIIKKWEDDIEKEIFTAKINKLGINFLGILNHDLEKTGYCLNKYINGEEYFGSYENDQRNRHGLYIWPKITEDKINKSEFYWGRWKNNLKDGRGIYLWLNEKNLKQPFNDFDNSQFDSLIGDFENDFCIKGVYLSKKNNNFYVYYGGFDELLKKNGENCFYFNANSEKIIYGKMVNNDFIEGYFGKYNEDGNIVDLIKVKFNSLKKISESTQNENIEENERKKVTEILTNFRNIIMEEDYFGDLYNYFKEIIEYKNNKMKDLEIFDNDIDYPNLMTLCSKYNSIKIYKMLEEYLKI